jgi:NAD(P)-dependent dehydrogenase (short-subunit alcohol dehydrogenase family)
MTPLERANGAGASRLSGAAIVVVGAATGIGGVIARELETQGGLVRLLDATPSDVSSTLDDAVQQLGELHAFVFADSCDIACDPKPVEDFTAQTWQAAFDEPLVRVVSWFQAAFPHLAPTRGRVVLVQPGVGITGAPEFFALAGLAEAQRALVKVAARAWRTAGISVNVIALRPDTFGARLAEPELTPVWHRVAAMGAGEGVPDPPVEIDAADDLGPLVAFLAGSEARTLTGQTVMLDGALWMLP